MLTILMQGSMVLKETESRIEASEQDIFRLLQVEQGLSKTKLLVQSICDVQLTIQYPPSSSR